jgi:hypothetical protein
MILKLLRRARVPLPSPAVCKRRSSSVRPSGRSCPAQYHGTRRSLCRSCPRNTRPARSPLRDPSDQPKLYSLRLPALHQPVTAYTPLLRQAANYTDFTKQNASKAWMKGLIHRINESIPSSHIAAALIPCLRVCHLFRLNVLVELFARQQSQLNRGLA